MVQVSKETMIGDLLRIDQNVAPILLNIGMHCLGCPSSQMETIEEAAMVHGIDADLLVEKMNFLKNLNEDERIKLFQDMGFSIKEIKVLIDAPAEVKKIAEFFGKTKQELLHYEADRFVPELQYMKEFSDTNNLDKILDLLDEYVDLKEAM